MNSEYDGDANSQHPEGQAGSESATSKAQVFQGAGAGIRSGPLPRTVLAGVCCAASGLALSESGNWRGGPFGTVGAGLGRKGCGGHDHPVYGPGAKGQDGTYVVPLVPR